MCLDLLGVSDNMGVSVNITMIKSFQANTTQILVFQEIITTVIRQSLKIIIPQNRQEMKP